MILKNLVTVAVIDSLELVSHIKMMAWGWWRFPDDGKTTHMYRLSGIKSLQVDLLP